MALTTARPHHSSCFLRIRLLVAAAFGLAFGSNSFSAEETHAIFPPLQIFKEFCLDAEWTLHAIAQLAEQHHYDLLASEDGSTPDGSRAHKGIWEAKTAVGKVGIIGVEGLSQSHGHTMTCTVTAPLDSTDFIQKWLRGSFGDPTSTLSRPPNATELHWTHKFDDGKIDVILLTRVPDGSSALLSVMKHMDSPKGRPGND
jgi:hypothetical protein